MIGVGRLLGYFLVAQALACSAGAPAPASAPAPAAQPAPPPAAKGGAKKGRIPPQVIQESVRKHFTHFRKCYEPGLARDPKLEGIVKARLVIDEVGSVSKVTDGGSSFPDQEVRECVLKGFYDIVFPKPDGGIVTVVYPIHLSPETSGSDTASDQAGKPASQLEATRVSGRMQPAVIQQIVRENFDAIRTCYEAGLVRDKNLRGKVKTRFVIGRNGKVSNVSDAGSDIPDAEVRKCVLKAFRGLKFPKPDAGIVIVVYPLMLDHD